MISGLKEGYSVEIMVEVIPEMFAKFEGDIVHRTYSTVSMIYHMEWASRQIIIPFLEEHEEGMGMAVSAKHLAPAPEGSKLKISAVLSEMKDNHVMTKVTVKKCEKIIGVGEVEQVILPKSKIAKMLE
ncbi:thioesterase [Bacillus sp. FJAT-49705]|uniref:Thioesterase n=1 Tax=Cytobacillus citreus TaxID=2833586 RepID=A0ABS5NNJ7_9BACI|nr:thioesterase [Cytobacillus citreus]MBS4189387.1 thioesterase [Cytobacillus citreus]